MEDFQSKYSGEQVEEFLDQIANGEIGGGIETEIDPIFSASPAASITEEKKTEWDSKQDKISDLDAIREGAGLGTTALQFVPLEYITEEELNNKGYATTSALNDKVDKVSGKQLSTEDFTSTLKTKLEGLSNYDDTELSEALSTLRGDFDKLVSGDTTTAIKTFNEVIAFLDGIQDSQDLSSILASIEQQVAEKMDKVTLATVATSGSYNDLSNKPTIPSAVTESTVSEWGFAKSSALQTKAEDSSVVHKTGNETISGAKTFNNGVNLLGSGDSNAVTLSTNTRINVNGTNQTVLGFGTGTFYINHGNYSLLLRGKDTRPKYNNTTLALSSDIPAAVTESTVSGWGFTKNTGTYSKPSTGIPKADLANAVQESLNKADSAYQKPTGGIPMNDLANNSVGVNQIVEGAVEGYHIADGEISNAKIADETISRTKIDSQFEEDLDRMGTAAFNAYVKPQGGIPTADIADGAITNAKIFDDTITSDKIASDSITTELIADKNVTKAKLSGDVQTSLGKADTALQSYTEQYKGTVTGVKINGTTKNPSSGVVDLGTVVTDISGKQDKLVSGTNIKTINRQSLLDSGDICVAEVDKTSGVDCVRADMLYAYESDGLYYALPGAINGNEDDIIATQNTLKTVNGQSLLGSGDISIGGGESFWYYENDEHLTTDYDVVLPTATILSLSAPEIGTGKTSCGTSGQVLTTDGEQCYWADAPSGGSGGEEYVNLSSSETNITLEKSKCYFLRARALKAYNFTIPLIIGATTRLVISASQYGPISFNGDNVVWPNDNSPIFEDNHYVEISFTILPTGAGTIGIFGVWTSYAENYLEGNMGGQ